MNRTKQNGSTLLVVLVLILGIASAIAQSAMRQAQQISHFELVDESIDAVAKITKGLERYYQTTCTTGDVEIEPLVGVYISEFVERPETFTYSSEIQEFGDAVRIRVSVTSGIDKFLQHHVNNGFVEGSSKQVADNEVTYVRSVGMDTSANRRAWESRMFTQNANSRCANH